MALVNLHTLPGLGRSNGGFAELPKFPEFPDMPAASLDGGFEATPEATGEAGNNFAALLEDAIAAVNTQDHKADQLAARSAIGEEVDPHTLMIEAAKAETMVHLTSSVATKMAQNVQTIMNMQI